MSKHHSSNSLVYIVDSSACDSCHSQLLLGIERVEEPFRTSSSSSWPSSPPSLLLTFATFRRGTRNVDDPLVGVEDLLVEVGEDGRERFTLTRARETVVLIQARRERAQTAARGSEEGGGKRGDG